MAEPVLKIKNVSRKFSNVLALKNVSLQVSSGEFIVICGRNGSGKSVLMSLIARLDEPTDGEISVPESGVGLVFQNADSQILGETPAEDVSFGLKNQKLPKKEIEITKKRHDFIVCLVNDMLEYELPNLGGTLVMSDSENGDFVYFDMSNKSIRNKYLSEQNRIMEDKLNFLKKNSIEKILLDTSSDYVNEIMKFFINRRR